MKLRILCLIVFMLIMFVSCELIINPTTSINVVPESIDFNNVQISSKVVKQIELTNVGSKNITLTHISIEVSNSITLSNEFELITPSHYPNIILKQNEQTMISVAFTPRSTGEKYAKLLCKYEYNEETETKEIAMSGNAFSGIIGVSPALITFPSTYIGEKRTEIITVTNNDTNTLTVTSVFFDDYGVNTTPNDFYIYAGWNGSQISLNPGQSISIAIVFNPLSYNEKSAKIFIKIAESNFQFNTLLKGFCCEKLEIVTPQVLSDGERGKSYTQQFTCKGGDGNYIFSVKNASLPNGLTLIDDSITGILQEQGDQTFIIEVNDKSGHSTYKSFSFHINYAKLYRDSTDVDLDYFFTINNDTGFYTINLIAEGDIPLTINSISLSGSGFISGETTFLIKPTLPLLMNNGDRTQIVIKVESLIDIGRSVILSVDHTGYNSAFSKEFVWRITQSCIFVIDRSGSMSSSYNGGYKVYDQNGNIIPYPNRWQGTQYETSMMINELDSNSLFEVIIFDTHVQMCFGSLQTASNIKKSQAINWIYSFNTTGCTNGYDGLRAAMNSYGQVDDVIFLSDGCMNTALSIGYGACSASNMINRMVTDIKVWHTYQMSLYSNFKLYSIQIGGSPMSFMTQLGSFPNAEFKIR